MYYFFNKVLNLPDANSHSFCICNGRHHLCYHDCQRLVRLSCVLCLSCYHQQCNCRLDILVNIFYKRFNKCNEVWKILSVIKNVKKIRAALFGSWLVLFVCCFAAYQVEKTRENAPGVELAFGTVETIKPLNNMHGLGFEDRRAGITLSVLAIIPTVVLGLQLILLHMMTYTPTPAIWGVKNEKQTNNFAVFWLYRMFVLLILHGWTFARNRQTNVGDKRWSIWKCCWSCRNVVIILIIRKSWTSHEGIVFEVFAIQKFCLFSIWCRSLQI